MNETSFTKRFREPFDFTFKVAGNSIQTSGFPDLFGIISGITCILELKVCYSIKIKMWYGDDLVSSFDKIGLTNRQHHTLLQIHKAYSKHRDSHHKVGVVRLIQDKEQRYIQYWELILGVWHLEKQKIWDCVDISSQFVIDLLRIEGI